MKELCHARRRMTYNGNKFTAKCTRIKGHEETAKKQPKQHFDQYRRVGWKDEADD